MGYNFMNLEATMKHRLLPLAAAAAITLSTGVALAANSAGHYSLSPFVGGYTFDGAQKNDTSFIYGLRFGYNLTDALGLEAVTNIGTSETRDGKMLNYRLEALYNIMPQSSFVPFLAAGYGVNRLQLEDENSVSRGHFGYGFGAKYFVADNFALRGDARHLIIDWGHSRENYEYTVGVSYFFGGPRPAPVVAAVPKAVVAAPAPPAPTSTLSVAPATVVKGVEATLAWTSRNTSDCAIMPGIGAVAPEGTMPVTPAVATDYTLSCTGPGGSTTSRANVAVIQPQVPMEAPPVDADRDGIPDSLDKCPGTMFGTTVDSTGCPLDTDRDGVYDYLDKCPGTPAGVAVDTVGCPLDTDRDGVYDYLDKCPGTPAGVAVDTVGCPLDSDRDGVYDYLDKCPGTPPGTTVDQNGCTPVVKSACKSLTLAVEFDTAKADIKPKFHQEIKQVADMLKDNPKATVVIEGHTDNVGGADMNMKLSQRRANSVRSYLIDKFSIAAPRIEAKGFGLTKPKASNKTPEGRYSNRRVEAVVSCGN
jgi:OOP family OmpA-OmpF porin